MERDLWPYATGLRTSPPAAPLLEKERFIYIRSLSLEKDRLGEVEPLSQFTDTVARSTVVARGSIVELGFKG